MPRCSLCGVIDDESTMLGLDTEDNSSLAFICRDHLKPEVLSKPKVLINPNISMLIEPIIEVFEEPSTSINSEETVKDYIDKHKTRLFRDSPNYGLGEKLSDCFIWEITDPAMMKNWSNKQLVNCLLESNVMVRPSCQKCGNKMRAKFRKNIVQNTWLCRIKGKDCSSSSMKSNSIFTAPHINIEDQVRAIISWIIGIKHKEIKDIQSSERQLSDLYKKLRFESWKEWKSLKIGGKKKAVEIRSYNFQELGFQKFGFEEEYFETYLVVFLERVENGKVYVEFMNEISAESVNDVLKVHILPDTSIICDEWRDLNSKKEKLSSTGNAVIQKAVELLRKKSISDDEAEEEEEQDISLYSRKKRAKIQTKMDSCDEVFEYLTKNLIDVWPKMSKLERDGMFAERICKFNGREDTFKYFWKLFVDHHNAGLSDF
ncbi:unnamed protein product [Caenorhabditis angaria]|uniref:Uncharacterized protein n=1 Tax=Caenorhabditis angaria TaxID=860376 RepID=A0A9P1ITY2_9PELO|nr:unnamed protein product [Caenorhabditis angaria]